MFENMENLKIISSFHDQSKAYGKVEGRQSHGFIVKISGRVEYNIDGEKVILNKGEMIFLPKGSRYEYSRNPDEDNLYTSINFQADLENPRARVYSVEDFYDIDYISDSFSEMWRFGSESDRYKCISVFYDLLSYILRLEHIESLEEKKYHMIEPAVEYIKKNIYNVNFKVNKLHRLCGISDTYFRKIFMSRFGMTPQKYLTIKRVSHAKSIIESGDFDTIKEVSELVGYEDPLYFSKVFKKIYGFPPSDITG